MTHLVGRTLSTGFQVGVRRTLDMPADDAWRFLTSPEGVRIWLGDTDDLQWTRGARYRLADGGVGEVRVVAEGSHLRLTWQPGPWPRPSTIQVRVIPKGERAVITFHQEHLPGPAERVERRAHFAAALDGIVQALL